MPSDGIEPVRGPRLQTELQNRAMHWVVVWTGPYDRVMARDRAVNQMFGAEHLHGFDPQGKVCAAELKVLGT